jgi:hypothetical protein
MTNLILIINNVIDFGEVEVQQLTDRFRNTLSAQGVVTEVSEMVTEWRLLKKLVYRR